MNADIKIINLITELSGEFTRIGFLRHSEKIKKHYVHGPTSDCLTKSQKGYFIRLVNGVKDFVKRNGLLKIHLQLKGDYFVLTTHTTESKTKILFLHLLKDLGMDKADYLEIRSL